MAEPENIKGWKGPNYRLRGEVVRALVWSAGASEARHRFGCSLERRIQSAVAATLCRRTPQDRRWKANAHAVTISFLTLNPYVY